jgi:hypothetical protein
MDAPGHADFCHRRIVASLPAGLTPFQIAVADLFFSLPESDGFLLAGGAALAAQHLTTRPTQDLDLFTRAGRSTVAAARDAFENATAERGWSIRRIRDSDTFCRLVVTGDEDLSSTSPWTPRRTCRRQAASPGPHSGSKNSPAANC